MKQIIHYSKLDMVWLCRSRIPVGREVFIALAHGDYYLPFRRLEEGEERDSNRTVQIPDLEFMSRPGFAGFNSTFFRCEPDLFCMRFAGARENKRERFSRFPRSLLQFSF